MIDNNKLDEITRNIAQLLPADTSVIRADIESAIRGVLSTALKNMDLVTREEFDIQTALLERTREKLDRLEKSLDSLRE